jgi:hypothetical protein
MTEISVDHVYGAAVSLCSEMEARIETDGERHVLG